MNIEELSLLAALFILKIFGDWEYLQRFIIFYKLWRSVVMNPIFS